MPRIFRSAINEYRVQILTIFGRWHFSEDLYEHILNLCQHYRRRFCIMHCLFSDLEATSTEEKSNVCRFVREQYEY